MDILLKNMSDGLEELTIHSYDWKTDEDPETGNTVIHCWAMDKNSKPHLVRFHDFDCFCYIELPMFLNNSLVRWEGQRAKMVYDTICYILGDDKPYRYRYEQKKKLYFYKGHDKSYPMLLVCFKNFKSMQTCKNKLKNPFKVRGLRGGNEDTMVPVRVWESDISVVRKMLTLRNCGYCQWFSVKGIKVKGDDKIATIENEYVADWKTISPIDMKQTLSWLNQPTVFSFDIETYSDRHNALPDPLCAKHVAYMVSIVYYRVRDPSSRRRIIILLGDCHNTEMAEVIRVKTEMELLEKFQNLIIELDPDIVIGYNILGYDNPYLENRLKRRMKDWIPLGRIKNKPTNMESISWSSSAYKNQDFNILVMDGRITLDLYPIVKRDYKLPLYKLDFVAKHFLGRGKHDVNAKEMFEIFELQMFAKENPPIDKSYIPERFIEHCKTKGIEDDDELFEAWKKDHRDFALSEMKRVVEYCIVDSDLVIDLFEKINVWISVIQMATIMGITPMDIFMRGTGVRMTSLMYDEAFKRGIVLDEVDFPKTTYEGGFVYDPIPGLYKYIACFDFSSLYPSIMRAYNIDHTTCVPPELMDVVPDEMCNVIEWTEEAEDDTESSDSENESSDSESDSEEDKNNKKAKTPEKKKKVIQYRYKFVKKEVFEGLMPKLLGRLIDERNNVRAKQKEVDKYSLEFAILEQTQLGIKIICNSFYGSCGSSFSKLKLPQASSSITARARESTKKMNEYLVSKGYKIVYGDTDSTMPDLNITDPTKAWETAEKVCKELTALFPPPMNVELEAIFDTMLSIKKKMYLCIYMDKKGKPIEDTDKMKIRGVTLARRDNCEYQRNFYKTTVWKVMHHSKFMDVFNYIVDTCLELVTRQVSWEKLTMIKGLGSNYKSKSYMMAVFSEEMQKGGNPLTPGDRITYLVVKTGNDIKDLNKVGYKMRTPEIFAERAESETPEHIDYLYYLEKTVRNGIEKQLFQVGYKNELEELAKKYREKDLEKFLKVFSDKNAHHRDIVNFLMEKHGGDKEAVANFLITSDFQKIAKPLYNFHVKRRQGRGRRLSSRIDKEPIMMMVRLMYAKAHVMKSVRDYNGRLKLRDGDVVENKQPEPKRVILKILPNNNNNNNNIQWIKEKTQKLKLMVRE